MALAGKTEGALDAIVGDVQHRQPTEVPRHEIAPLAAIIILVAFGVAHLS